MGLRAPRLTPTFVNSPDNRCVAQRNAHLPSRPPSWRRAQRRTRLVRRGTPADGACGRTIRLPPAVGRRHHRSARIRRARRGSREAAVTTGHGELRSRMEMRPSGCWRSAAAESWGVARSGQLFQRGLVRRRVSRHPCFRRPQRARSSSAWLPNPLPRPPLCSADPCPSLRAQARAGVGLRDAGASGGSSIPRSGQPRSTCPHSKPTPP